MRWTDWQSKAAAGTVENFDEADLPGVLSGIRTHDGPPFGPLLARPAIVADNRERTWAVVARITHPGIGLSEVPARTRMGNGLSELLEGAATAELVSVIALQIRTVPDDGAERAAWQQANLRTDAPSLALAVNAELAQVMTQAGVRHEAFVTSSCRKRRIAKQAKEAGGGVDGRARVLYGVMGEVEARLIGPVGCSSVTWLDSPALAAAIRTGFAPGDRAGLDRGRHRRPERPERRGDAADGRRRADLDTEPGAPLLRPRRLALGDLHDPAARQGRGDGRPRAGVHADHGGGAALGHRVLRADQPRQGRPDGRSESMSSDLAAEIAPQVAGSRSAPRTAATPPGSRARTSGWPTATRSCGSESPPRSRCPTPGRSPTTGDGWNPASPAPASRRCGWTWPRTPASPPPASRSASACPSGEASSEPPRQRWPSRREGRGAAGRRLRSPAAAAGPGAGPGEGRRPVHRDGRQARPHRPRRRLGAGAGSVAGVPDDLGAGRRGVAADRRRRAPVDRRAAGHRLPVRRRVPRRPDRLDAARHRRGHQPEHDVLRRPGPREVRHGQDVLPADDGLRLPHPDPGRRQGRVRAAVPGARSASRTPSGTACPPGSTPSISGRWATTGPRCPAPRRNGARRWCSPAGCC